MVVFDGDASKLHTKKRWIDWVKLGNQTEQTNLSLAVFLEESKRKFVYLEGVIVGIKTKA
jgi:hypothetical protein